MADKVVKMVAEAKVVKIDQAEIDELEVKYSNIRSLSRWGILLVSAIAIISSFYHLYASVYMPNYQLHLSMHLMFMITLAFFVYPLWTKTLTGQRNKDRIPVYDLFLGGLSAAVCLYWVFYYQDIVMRSGMESQLDLLVGAVGIVLVLEATRRVVGPALSIIAGLFMIYAYVGAYLPGLLNHRGYSIERIISQLWYTDQGIFGVPLYVSAIYVIVFILFGAFLKYSGAGDFFINLAYALTGWRKGGPAKTSVLASGFFGMISGSSIANAVTVGSFTIPLMKKAGYRKEFAGAVEAASSTGGQIMPPVMGAAAFIMVEFTGIPYSEIIVAAIVPAIAFFTGVWIMAHLEAGRVGLKSVSKSELPDWKKLVVENGYVSISVFLLLYLILIAKVSIPYAGVFSIISIIALSYVPDFIRLIREQKYLIIGGIALSYIALSMVSIFVLHFSVMMTIFYAMLPLIIILVPVCHFKGYNLQGMNIGKFRLALEEGTKGASGVALACATAGIISGVATLTGLGLKIAMLVATISGGSLFIALILTMIACLILGMGLPTTATYIVLVTMAAPALVQMHLPSGALIPILSIHMFVLYYGVLADVTPPVALAAYAASGIAKSNQFRTGIEAFKISMNKMMVPFAFVYSPAILLIGINWSSSISVAGAAFDIATMFLGILCLQTALTGYWLTHMSKIVRVALFIAALGLIFPNVPGAIYGIAVLIGVYILQKSQILAGPDGKFMDGFRKMFPV